jgi:peptidyl-prolyl cis-trans isomerase D
MAMLITNFNKLIQSKLVWGLFIALVVFAFVAMDIATPERSPQKKATDPIGIIFDEEVTRGEYEYAYRGVYLLYVLATGSEPRLDEQTDTLLQESAWQRLAILKKANQLGFSISDEQLVRGIQSLPLFRDPDNGQFNAQQYSNFVSGFLPRIGFDAKLFEQSHAENLLIEEISRALSGSVEVNEDEILQAYRDLNDRCTIEHLTVSRDLAANPAVSEEQVKIYFEENQRAFELPEKVYVHYVDFPVSDYLGKTQITDIMVSQVYSNNLERYAIENETGDVAYQPLSEVRAELYDLIDQEAARQKAYQAADQLVARLSEEVDFATAAAELNLSVVENTPSFNVAETLPNIDPTAPFTRASVALEESETHYYSDPVLGRDHIYVIALQKKWPAFIPPYESVREEVRTAAQAQANAVAYQVYANDLFTTFQDALAADRTFAEVAQEYNLSITTTAPFNAATPLEGPLATQLMERVFQLNAGDLARPILSEEGYIFLSLATREAADTTALGAQRLAIIQALENQKRVSQINAWQDKVVEEAAIERFEDKSTS